MISPYCSIEGCERFREGNTNKCASHNNLQRRSDRQIKSNVEKLENKKEIKKVSEKEAGRLRIYSVKKKKHLEEHPDCQLKLEGCTNQNNTVHHAAKRGKNLTNEETFLTACFHCHNIVETVMSAKDRREKGFLI